MANRIQNICVGTYKESSVSKDILSLEHAVGNFIHVKMASQHYENLIILFTEILRNVDLKKFILPIILRMTP